MNMALITSAKDIVDIADLCTAAGSFALDTEADSLHSYYHKVCLIQVTARQKTFLIDALALEKVALEPLWRAVQSSKTTVLMHGADYDLRILDRDHDVRFTGLQDTQIMAQFLGEEHTGLAALLEKELNITLDKRFQRADWGRRPLPQGFLEYAAADTAHLEQLVGILRARLEELGRWSWALEDCERLMTVRFEPPADDPLAFERIKGARKLKHEARHRLYSLYLWREKRAQDLDVPPFKIIGPRQMLEIAEKPPADIDELSHMHGLGPRFARRYGRRVLQCIQSPQAAPERRRPDKHIPLSARERQRTTELLATRDQIAADLALTPSLLCTKGQATVIAMQEPPPATTDALTATGLTGWRRDVLGDAFIAALGKDP